MHDKQCTTPPHLPHNEVGIGLFTVSFSTPEDVPYENMWADACKHVCFLFLREHESDYINMDIGCRSTLNPG